MVVTLYRTDTSYVHMEEIIHHIYVQNVIKDQRIIEPISELCLLYYHQNDYFEKGGFAIVINNESTFTVTATNESINTYPVKMYPPPEQNIAIGGMNIDITKGDTRSMIYSWSFKLMCPKSQFVSIGIYNHHQTQMGWDSHRTNGTRLKVNDIITMDLDFMHGRLKFYVNKRQLPWPRWNIKFEHRIYRMVVVARDQGTVVKLIKFDKR